MFEGERKGKLNGQHMTDERTEFSLHSQGAPTAQRK